MEHLSTDRRGFMKVASVIAAATAASSISVCGASAQQVPYSAGTEAPNHTRRTHPKIRSQG